MRNRIREADNQKKKRLQGGKKLNCMGGEQPGRRREEKLKTTIRKQRGLNFKTKNDRGGKVGLNPGKKKVIPEANASKEESLLREKDDYRHGGWTGQRGGGGIAYIRARCQ